MDENCNVFSVNVNQVLRAVFNLNETLVARSNLLILLNAILVGVLVVISAYAPRFRRHPLVGFLFLGATVLFLPITSDVVSTVVTTQSFIVSLRHLFPDVPCEQSLFLILVLLWTGLVLVIGITTSTAVAGDEREGRNADPPAELVIKAVWIGYLTISYNVTVASNLTNGHLSQPVNIKQLAGVMVVQLFVIIFSKLLLKYTMFYIAQRSFAFGRNPRLIAGYMAELQQQQNTVPTDHGQGQVDDNNHAVQARPPALIVLGEGTLKVKIQPHGCSLTRTRDQPAGNTTSEVNISTRLVTLDRVWQLDDILERSIAAEAKDLCFSFALFKLLRCRFARYTVIEAGFIKAHKLFQQTYLQGDDYERAFRVVANELSFIHDYYYSSLPISYSHLWLPALSIILSLYSIGYSLYVIRFVYLVKMAKGSDSLITCSYRCIPEGPWVELGSYIVAPAVHLVILLLVLAETRLIISYVCSDWTKVAIIYLYVNHPSCPGSPAVKKFIGFVLKHCRCRLLNNSWVDKMKQRSVLVLPHRRRNRFLVCCHRNGAKKVKVTSAVKASIFEALKAEGLTNKPVQLQGSHGRPGDGLNHIRPPLSPISLSANGGKHAAHSILVWHLATSMFEVRHPFPSYPEGHKIAATQLSHYCAYLVADRPELLPEDEEWCKSMYKAVKKDADRVLKGYTASPGHPEAEYHMLVDLLSADSNHEVLKKGARLGMQLVDSETTWEALARFWSEMILYVAPSENLDGHAEAIARGGELITLLWALLAHAGIVDRVHADVSAAASDDAGPV